jgi:cytidylate kinase
MAKTIEQIVDEQVRVWAQHQEGLRRRNQARLHWPIMTFSREFGAQGRALAAIVGGRLGFRVWDTDLVHAIAEVAGGDDAMMASLDEHRRRAIDDMVHGTLQSVDSNIHYLRALMRVVYTIEEHGRSIIVGRGANYIARGKKVLRVRVVCPLEERIRRYAQRQQIDEQEAERKIEEIDAERADFIEHHFWRDAAAPSDYDLVLNSGSYGLEELADVLVAAYEVKVGRRVERVDAG